MASAAAASSHISPSKQTRIDIWRTEVAALTITTPSPTTPTSSASTTTTAATSSSSSSSSTHSHPHQHERRRRSLWRRLARRISGRDEDRARVGDEDAWDHDVRTDMYRVIADKKPEVEAEVEEVRHDAEVGLGEESSDGGKGGGKLKEKQERLERAARLLERGAAHGRERP